MSAKSILKYFAVLVMFSTDLRTQEISFQRILSSYEKGYYQKAIELSEKLKNINENEKIALIYILAHSYFKLDKYEKALAYFENILEFSPYKYEVYNNIGACHYHLKDYYSALAAFKKSLQDNPNYKIAQMNYLIVEKVINNVLKNENSDYQQAAKTVKMLEKYELFSMSSTAINDVNLAWLYYYMGKYLEAIHLLKNAIKNDPEYSLPYMSLGYIYDSIYNHKTALKYYKKALELDNEYPDLWNNIAITYFFLGEEKQAIRHFEKAIDLNPTYTYPLNNLGFLYLHKRNIDKAILYFTKVLEIENRDPMILSESNAGLAICYYYKNKINDALNRKKQAVAFNGNLADEIYLSKYLRWNKDMIDVFLNKLN